MAYREGYSAAWYVTLQALAFIPFAYIAVPKIYPLKETTLAEYLESRYRPWLRPLSAVALALATFAILPAQIVGGASVLTALVGLDYTTAFLVVGVTLILYSALGGMPSVTYGDVYQWVLMLGGFLIGVPIFISAAGGLSQVMAAVPQSHASWWHGATGTWEPATIAAWLVTVVMARFVPIVRTFAPFVAGVGSMTYAKFATYNVLGAILWVTSCLAAGYVFGNVPIVREHFTLVVLGIVFVSILPGIIEYARHRRDAARQ